MAKNDLIISAAIDTLNLDKAAKEDLKKQVSQVLKQVSVNLDAKTMEHQFSLIAEHFGRALSISIKNAITKNVQQELHFDKTGKSLQSSAIESSAKAHVSRHTAGYQGTLSPSGNKGAVGLWADDKIIEQAVKVAEELNATKTAIKKIRENFAAALSGFGIDKATGKWYGSLELGKGQSVSLGGSYGRREGGYDLTELNPGNVEYSATKAGAKYYKKSMSAVRELKDVEKLIEIQTKLNELTGKQEIGAKSLEELEKRRLKLLKEIKAVEKGGTATQKEAVKEANKKLQNKQKEKELAAEVKQKESEQTKAYREAVTILNQINGLKKQSIANQDKQNYKELNEINSKRIAILQNELKTKEAVLSVTQKEKLAEMEKTHAAQQNLLQQEKALKLRSTRNQKGSFMDEVETAFSRVTTYGVAYNLVNLFKNSVKATIGKIIEFDKVMTNLQIITKGSDEEVKNLTQSYVELGEKLGATSQKVFEAADLWLRQGRSVAETNELIEATMIMANIAQIDSAKSADILTSAINGFKLEAKDAMHVVDVFAAIDLAAAANTEELAEAMQRVAATAGEVGISIENITAYIATLVDATRLDSGTIGSALNTILSRLQKVKLGEMVEGEDTNLSDVQTALAQIGVELFDVSGSFKNMDTVLGEVAQKWSTLNDVEKSSIAYAVAGVRQRNLFLQLMNNWDKSLYLSTVALNAENTAMDKQKVYLDSYEAKINSLSDAWDKFVTKNTSSEFFKGLIEALKNIVDWLDKAKIGLSTLLGLLASGALASLSGVTGHQPKFIQNIKSILGNTFGGITAKGSAQQTQTVMNSYLSEKLSGSVSEDLKALEKEIVSMGLSTKKTAQIVRATANSNILAYQQVDSQARSRMSIYRELGLTTEQIVQIEKDLAQARIATGNASFQEIKQEKGTKGAIFSKAGSVISKGMQAAGAAMMTYQIVGVITNSISALFKSSDNPLQEIEDKLSKIDERLEKSGRATQTQENLDLLDKIANQISSEGVTVEMQEQLSEVIKVLNKNLNTTIDLLEVDKDGNKIVRDLKDVVNDYNEIVLGMTAEDFLTAEKKEAIKQLQDLQGAQYRAYTTNTNGWDAAGSLSQNVLSGAVGGAIAGSAIPGIGNIVGMLVGIAGGLIVTAFQSAGKKFDEVVAEGEKVTLSEAIRRTKANKEAAEEAGYSAEIISEFDKHIEDLKNIQNEIAEKQAEIQKEYAAQFGSYATGMGKKMGLASTDVDIVKSIASIVSGELTVDQLADAETYDILQQAVNETLLKMQGTVEEGTKAAYGELADLFSDGGPFAQLIGENTSAIQQIQAVISSAAPTLATAISALRKSIDKQLEGLDRQINAANAEAALLSKISEVGFNLNMKGDEVSSLLNIGGEVNASKILDPAYRKYVQELTDLYQEYWGEDGKIANKTELQTEEQLTKEYERAVALKEKEYEIMQKQLEVQEAQNKLSQAQRERDTLVFRNGHFMYEANPATIQQLQEEKKAAETAIEQLQVQKDIESHTKTTLDYLESISASLNAFKEYVEGDVTAQPEMTKLFKEMFQQELEANEGKIVNPLLRSFYDLIVGNADKGITGLGKDAQDRIYELLGLEKGKVYDSGGLLKGRGLFNKQSIGDEVVLSPTDAPRVLSLLSKTEDFQNTVNNADNLLKSLTMRDGKLTSLLDGGTNNSQNFYVENVNVEEASDIEGILISAQQKIQMTNPRFIRG